VPPAADIQPLIAGQPCCFAPLPPSLPSFT